MLEFIKNPSKIVKNDAQERSGGDLGKGSVPGQIQEQARDDFWSLLAPLGRFWVILGPLKIQGGAKNEPKKSIRRLLGVRERSWERKTFFLEGPGKHIDF